MKKAFGCVFLILLSLAFSLSSAEEIRITPAHDVSDSIQALIETAERELGYTEGEHGYTKYGEWSGDPYAQWCAEFLCWCVHEVDESTGSHMLNEVYPMYSSSNVGKNWFVDHGRYIVRWGNLEGWGYQWLKGENEFISTGSYIPEPGDWVFFTWTNDENTDHVAMVEYCTRNSATQEVTIHVIEGNTPSAVIHAQYPLTYKRILGFGTVHDCADWTMRAGNTGEKVRQLQEKLHRLGLLSAERVDGRFGPSTQSALQLFQNEHDIKSNGIANITTQKALNQAYEHLINQDPSTWRVDSDADDDALTLDFFDFIPVPSPSASPAEEELSLVDSVENDADMDADVNDDVPDWVDVP